MSKSVKTLVSLHLEKTRLVQEWINGNISTEDFDDARDFLLAIMYPFA